MIDINSSALIDLLRSERAAGNPELMQHLNEVAEECESSGKSALAMNLVRAIQSKKNVEKIYVEIVSNDGSFKY